MPRQPFARCGLVVRFVAPATFESAKWQATIGMEKT
jgi:hypothetical protein